jgi:Astacin (Peptidase family M12A)
MKTAAHDGEGQVMTFVPCRIKPVPAEAVFSAAETARQINPVNAPAFDALRIAAPDAVIAPEHLAILTSRYWGSQGVHLTVSFLDDAEQELQERILSHMNAWQQFCNATFELVASGGDVRIARVADGYWSYLGTDISTIPADEPTMNLEAFSMDTPEGEYHRVVRHETGHTLGFPHEHRREEIVNRIDHDKAIAFFGEPPNNWSAQMVTQQVLTPIAKSALKETDLADERSIMSYALPAEIMKDGAVCLVASILTRWTRNSRQVSIHRKSETDRFSKHMIIRESTLNPKRPHGGLEAG